MPRLPLALAVLLAAAATAVTCGGGSAQPTPTPDTAWTPAAIPLAELRLRAIAAVTRPGQVFHVTTRLSVTGAEGSPEAQMWLDVDGDVSRAEYDVSRDGTPAVDVTVYYARRVAMLGPDRRFWDGVHDSPLARPSIVAVPYLDTIFNQDLRQVRIETSAVGGVRLIADAPGTGDYVRAVEHHRVELNASFLPVRTEMTTDAYPDGKTRTRATDYTYDFQPRDALAPGFFSPDAVRAIASTPADDLAAALAAGLRAYWLGPSYEGAEPSPYTSWAPAAAGQPDALLLRYAPPGGGMVPVPCVTIVEYRRDDWDDRPRRSTQDGTVIATFDVPDGAATIYSVGTGPLLATPAISGGGTAPTSPPLPLVPDDVGEYVEGVVLYADTAVSVTPNCGPPGTNAFRTRAGFERLVRALVPFTP